MTFSAFHPRRRRKKRDRKGRWRRRARRMKAENHRRRDEHRDWRTLGLRLGLESSGFGSIRVVPEHLSRQRTGDPSLLGSHDNGDPASVAAAAKAVHPMFQSAASCRFSTLPKIPSALFKNFKTLFLDRVSFLREPTISGNLPWLVPGDVDHQSKDRNRKQRDGGEKAQLFHRGMLRFFPSRSSGRSTTPTRSRWLRSTAYSWAFA